MHIVPKYNLVPGPTSVPSDVLEKHCLNFASTDLEEDFWKDYNSVVQSLQQILRTTNDIAILSGEGMVALWGAMKSVIKSGDKVISVVNGLYGNGFAEIATSLGAIVQKIETDWTKEIDNEEVIKIIKKEKPSLVTMVHCETPTGMLNSLTGIGQATRNIGSLFLVDFVSSGGGITLDVDKECIDLGLLGSQKVFSSPPSLSFVTISEKAWKVIENVNYIGYDALKPFHKVEKTKFLPYTHNWHSIAAFKVSCEKMIQEGIENIWNRHLESQNICLTRGKQMGLKLYIENTSYSSPTVTAFQIPVDISWNNLNSELRKKNMIVGGCYEHLAGKVFRIGHMGTQADPSFIKEAMDILENVLTNLRS